MSEVDPTDAPLDLLAGLNPAQADAVTHVDGPLLVLAGAGSGKTRVLTHRIAHLIRDHGVSPFSILAITFTNKAADEMKQRVAALVGPVAQKMWVSTFHSACVRILRREAPRLGYPSSFTIYDQADAVRLTTYVLRDLDIDTKRFPPRGVHAAISAAKNRGLGVDAYEAAATNPFERRYAEAYREYQARLRKAGAMDFDDLLGVTVEVLRTFPDALEHYQRRFTHILVDEYQDTNPVQNDLVMLLGAAHRNVCVVGDHDQCFPPGTPVSTPQGSRPIEDLVEGDEVWGSGADGRRHRSTVAATHEGRWSGRTVPDAGRRSVDRRHPPPHPPRPPDAAGGPVGRVPDGAVGPRLPHRRHQEHAARWARRAQIGPRVRVNQEHGDRVWILRVCPTRGEAGFWEALYSAEYGLPTACFHGMGRSLVMDEEHIHRLYLELDTESRAKALMEDLDLHPDFPHHRPAGGGRRQTVNLTMFSDRRTGIGYHRVQWCSNRPEVADRLRNAGLTAPGRGLSFAPLRDVPQGLG